MRKADNPKNSGLQQRALEYRRSGKGENNKPEKMNKKEGREFEYD